MEKNQLQRELMYLTSRTQNGQFKDKQKACELVHAVMNEVIKLCGGDIIEMCNSIIAMEKGTVQNCTANSESVQNCTGYVNSLSVETYEEIDKLIREGFSNQKISDKTGVHRNTISKRRKMLGAGTYGKSNNH